MSQASTKGASAPAPKKKSGGVPPTGSQDSRLETNSTSSVSKDATKSDTKGQRYVRLLNAERPFDSISIALIAQHNIAIGYSVRSTSILASTLILCTLHHVSFH
jgi:hypothetical protein